MRSNPQSKLCTPAVVYGPSGNVNLTFKNADLRNLFKELAGGAAIIEITYGENTIETLIQDIQRDAIKDIYNHIDFKELVRGQEINTTVPVIVNGESFGEKNEGGV